MSLSIEYALTEVDRYLDSINAVVYQKTLDSSAPSLLIATQDPGSYNATKGLIKEILTQSCSRSLTIVAAGIAKKQFIEGHF